MVNTGRLRWSTCPRCGSDMAGRRECPCTWTKPEIDNDEETTP